MMTSGKQITNGPIPEINTSHCLKQHNPLINLMSHQGHKTTCD